MTPLEIIREVERDAENDAEYVIGGPLATSILAALDRAGYVIVSKDAAAAIDALYEANRPWKCPDCGAAESGISNAHPPAA